jgi:phosphopentomutase
MSRAFILMFDSFGVGAADDALKFGDEGANTFGHIAEACFKGEADKEGLREGPLKIPYLMELGLGEAALEAAEGEKLPGIPKTDYTRGVYGYAQELSHGKDTPSGHWEMAGVPVMFDWGYFSTDYPSFPPELIGQLIEETGIPGVLGNKHASGTEIINELGDEHIKTGKPIVYTSADSVFQIACHEKHFGLEKLLKLCDVARKLVDGYNIGRVIARPFIGADGDYERTANRKDLSVLPPAPTLLNKVKDAGNEVIAIGKIGDIYAHSGTTQEIKGDGNMDLFDKLMEAARSAPNNSLTFVNFVDFDSKYGHRRDIPGYANALEEIDKRMPEFEAALKQGDLALITADHGCDPSFPGSDHTREYVPVVFFGPEISSRAVGKRHSFADMGQTIARHLGLEDLSHGEAIQFVD